MTITDVKQIRISDYLHSLGYSPVKQQGGNLWYKSPFRQESEPSFKVNTELNLWYDFDAQARAAISLHWRRNFTLPMICIAFWKR